MSKFKIIINVTCTILLPRPSPDVEQDYAICGNICLLKCNTTNSLVAKIRGGSRGQGCSGPLRNANMIKKEKFLVHFGLNPKKSWKSGKLMNQEVHKKCPPLSKRLYPHLKYANYYVFMYEGLGVCLGQKINKYVAITTSNHVSCTYIHV